MTNSPPENMKTNTLLALQLPSLAAGLMLTLLAPAVAAVVEKKEPVSDTASSQDEITATGVVFSVEPEILSVVMKDNPTPVRFVIAKDTPFLDEKGAAVPVDLVRSELPLTVHYSMEGEKMVARRVVMSRSMVAGDANEKPSKKRMELAEEKAQETTRAAEAEQTTGRQEITGTVSTIEQTISVVARGESTPTTFIINNSTRFVNASGQPVSPQMLMGGMPVNIKTVRDGKRVIAQEIVVRGTSTTMSGNNASQTQGGSGEGSGTADGGGSLRTNNNRGTSGNSNGLSELQSVQGFVIPGDNRLPPGTGNPNNPEMLDTPGNPGRGTNPGQGNNPNQGTNPGQGTTNPNQGTNPGQGANSGQPTNPQPKGTPANPRQPNVPPAGEKQVPNQNKSGNKSGNNNGTNQSGQNGGGNRSGSGGNSGKDSGGNGSGTDGGAYRAN